MTKKCISLLLLTVLVLSLNASTTVPLCATVQNPFAVSAADNTATITDATFNVTITWDTPSVTLTEVRTWDPSSLSYTFNRNESPDHVDFVLNAANASSVPIAVTFAYDAPTTDNLFSSYTATLAQGTSDFVDPDVFNATAEDRPIATGSNMDFTLRVACSGLPQTQLSAEDLAKNNFGTVTVTVAVVRETQTAPAAPTVLSTTSSTLTLNAVTTTGYGAVQYACATTDTAPATGWQTSPTFTDLVEGTNYWFFARYTGDSTHYPAVSAGALLGFGHSVTLDVMKTSSTDANNDGYIEITRLDGSVLSGTMRASNDGIFKHHITVLNDSSSAFADGEHLIYPVTLTNVAEIERNDGNYIIYRDSSGNYYTHEFKDGPLVVSKDITVTAGGVAQCIDENSLITMADGTTKAMKDIEIGDEVLSIDFDTMTLVARKVIYTSKDEANYANWTVPSYYKYTFSDGTVIKRAMRHRFYSLEAQGYKHLHTWDLGEHAYNLDGTNPTLVSVEIIQEELHYARITLEGSNNYFANGLATGDSECCPYAVTLDSLLQKAE